MPLGVPPHAPVGSASGEAVGQGGVPPPGAGDADGLADCFRGTDEDDEFLWKPCYVPMPASPRPSGLSFR